MSTFPTISQQIPTHIYTVSLYYSYRELTFAPVLFSHHHLTVLFSISPKKLCSIVLHTLAAYMYVLFYNLVLSSLTVRMNKDEQHRCTRAVETPLCARRCYPDWYHQHVDVTLLSKQQTRSQEDRHRHYRQTNCFR